ncbi:MAG: class I SAM-dependent methyltransferase, partial [Acidimicrobiia bacterium]
GSTIRPMGGQFHLDADTYLSMIRSEVQGYDELQALVARATADVPARMILDLGTGTGETALATLKLHPDADLIGIDASEEMLAVARQRLPSAQLIVSRIEDPLPVGPFDVVMSAFAVHHLDGPGKADLFRRISDVLSPGGRFVMLDVVIPAQPVASPIRLEEGVDMPSTVDEMLGWLREGGLKPEVVYSAGDLAVLAAEPAA